MAQRQRRVYNDRSKKKITCSLMRPSGNLFCKQTGIHISYKNGGHAWSVATASPITHDNIEAATELARIQLDADFFRVRFDRSTPIVKLYLGAMAEIDSPNPRSGDIAAAMHKEVNQVAPVRQSLIAKGMIYGLAHGDNTFTVPLFADYME